MMIQVLGAVLVGDEEYDDDEIKCLIDVDVGECDTGWRFRESSDPGTLTVRWCKSDHVTFTGKRALPECLEFLAKKCMTK